MMAGNREVEAFKAFTPPDCLVCQAQVIPSIDLTDAGCPECGAEFLIVEGKLVEN